MRAVKVLRLKTVGFQKRIAFILLYKGFSQPREILFSWKQTLCLSELRGHKLMHFGKTFKSNMSDNCSIMHLNLRC